MYSNACSLLREGLATKLAEASGNNPALCSEARGFAYAAFICGAIDSTEFDRACAAIRGDGSILGVIEMLTATPEQPCQA